MIIVDSLIIGAVKFVLNKVMAAVDEELNDDTHLREQLLEAQMRFELGELSAEELGQFEADVLARLRDIQERRGGGPIDMGTPGDFEVTGVDAEAQLGHAGDQDK